jgi:hypothetical protein
LKKYGVGVYGSFLPNLVRNDFDKPFFVTPVLVRYVEPHATFFKKGNSKSFFPDLLFRENFDPFFKTPLLWHKEE